jgi:hypothetical protein
MRRWALWSGACFFGSLVLLACASDVTEDDLGTGAGGAQGGAGGDGGVGATGGGGTGGDATSTGGTGGAGGSPDGGGGSGAGSVCGNDIIEAGESCEGKDFNGATCESFGLGPGDLICNSFCQVVASGCAKPENCLNGFDDDGDGLIDCLDPDCAGVLQCVDSCAAPATVTFWPAWEWSSNVGRPDVYAPSCSAATGPEKIFQVTPPFSGVLGISVESSKNFSVSVMTTCGDLNTEIGCAASVHMPGFSENLSVTVAANNTYYVMVDGAGATEVGEFTIQMNQITNAESVCNDLYDQDFDGYLDCDDLTNCQTSAACIPGAKTYGQPCFSNTECQATGNDPICMPSSMGFPNGYCSEFCDVAANDCSGDGLCYAIGISHNGVCLDGCTTQADCSPGAACVNLGLATNVCYIPPEVACNDYDDNDNDGLTDCEDPTDCQTLAACAPGPSPAGSPCSQHNHCAAVGNDPFCFSQSFWGISNGYCSEFCNLALNDCSPGSSCASWAFWPSGAGNCFKDCTSQNDCPFNTFCFDPGIGKSVCIP